MSVVIHEVSHGYMANMLGDPTAKNAGRLTLNPLKHLDMFGSFILPAVMWFSTGFLFGWAKPVPYNPYNLRHQRYGTALVGAAGAMANFLIAIIFGLIIRFADVLSLSGPFFDIAILIVFLNILLGVFNLIPVPPLDGSKVLFAILPFRFRYIQVFMERNWIILLIAVFFFVWSLIFPIISLMFSLVTGIPFGV